MDCWPDWSGIFPDLLIEISLHLPPYEDFTAFRGVCTNWRAAGAAKAKMFKGLGRVHVLILAEKDDSDEREFYSLCKSKIFMRMPLPEAKGKRCIDVGFGWILTLSNACQGFEVSLFNPFCSAAKIVIPHTLTFPRYEHHTHLKARSIRAVLSANPSLTSNFTVFVVVNFYSPGFWKTGDKSWTWLDESFRVCGNIGYYKEKMYVVSQYGTLLSWDPNGTNPTKTRMILQWHNPLVRNICGTPHLVESSDGELLIIWRNNVDYWPNCNPYVETTHFGVMRVDPVKMECQETNGILGKNAVFLGNNAPVAVAAADFPGVLKPNCFYFTDGWWYPCSQCGKGIGKDIGIYNLRDGSMERFDVESFSQICPPLWIFPSF